MDESEKAESLPLRLLSQQGTARVDSNQVLSVPFAVVVALTWESRFVPGGESFVEQKIQLKVDVSAVPGNRLPRVGRAAHHRDRFAALDRLPCLQAVSDFVQMRVKRVDLQPFYLVAKDDVVAVVGERRTVVDVNDRSVSSGQHRIGRFAPRVALQATDVQSLMHLPSVS